MITYILQNTQLNEKNITNTISLLNEDCTIPFISRYRKEATGNLDEVQIGEIVKYKEQFEVLEKRKSSILKVLKEQNDLTEDLMQSIEKAQNLIALEDLYSTL